MMDTPLVSVCIPAFNAGRYIAAALNSVLAQTYSNLEIIVVDDGSTDNTAEVLSGFADKGIRVITQANKGQCAAANTAFAHSKGDYIKFFDADDLLNPTFIEYQVLRLGGRTDAVASARWGRFFHDDINSFQLNPEPVWQDMAPIEWLVSSMEKGPNMMQCALWLIPRQVLASSGLWNEELSLINDFDFFIRVLLAAKEVLFTPEATLYYRSSVSNSLSAQVSPKAMLSAYRSTELGVATILSFEDSPRTRRICADSFQSWVYQFFPDHMELYRKATERIQALGGSDYPFPANGKSRTLQRLVGWKNVKRLKKLVY